MIARLFHRAADFVFQPLANVGVAAFIALLEARDAAQCEFANVTDEDES